MAKSINTFSLGLTVIVIVALFFTSLMFIGGSELFAPAKAPYVVRYPASSPLPDELAVGAPVYCGLQMVGEVVTITQKRATDETLGHEELYAYVDFEVNQTLLLRSDCRIVVRGPLLGGGGKLVITDPGWEGEKLEPGAIIEGHQAGDFNSAVAMLSSELNPNEPGSLMSEIKTQLDAGNMQSLMAKVHRSIDDINAITKALALEARPEDQDAILAKLEHIVDNINTMTGTLRNQLAVGPDDNLMDKVQDGLDAVNANLDLVLSVLEQNRENVNEIFAGVRRSVDTLDTGITTPIAEQLDMTRDTSLIAKVHVTFDRLNRSMADVNVITDSTADVIVLNKERLNSIFANVSETSKHLKAASKELRRNPWRLLYRPTLEQTKELNIFDASREFSSAAEYLDDAAAQLKSLMEARGGEIPADDPDLIKVRDRLNETFKNYSEAEEALWRALSVAR